MKIVVIKTKTGLADFGGFHFKKGVRRYTGLSSKTMEAIRARIAELGTDAGFVIEEHQDSLENDLKAVPTIHPDFDTWTRAKLDKVGRRLGLDTGDRNQYPRLEKIVEAIQDMIADGEVKVADSE